MGLISRFKYLYGFVLVMSVVLVVVKAVSLSKAFLAGAEMESDQIGSFALSACQIPMWLLFFQLSLSRPNGLREEQGSQVFERSAKDQTSWAIVIWATACGLFISSLLSDGNRTGFLAGGQWQLWCGLLMGSAALCVALFAWFGIWTRRLVLSKDGISTEQTKSGPIRWEDVSDIRFFTFLGSRQIAVDVTDPAKYGLKKSPLVIYPETFNAHPEAMMEILERERTLNLL